MTAESGEAEARDEKTERRRRDRERQQSDTDPTTGSLTQRERSDVSEHRRLSSVTVYAILYAEGEEELGRPVNSLWWSGLAAGIAISTSLLVEAILYNVFEDHPRREFIAYIGYSSLSSCRGYSCSRRIPFWSFYRCSAISADTGCGVPHAYGLWCWLPISWVLSPPLSSRSISIPPRQSISPA